MVVTFRTHALPPLATPRSFHTGALLVDGRVVLVGGCARSGPAPSGACVDECWSIADVELLDPSRGTIARAPSLARARQQAHLWVVPGKGLLVAGGFADHG